MQPYLNSNKLQLYSAKHCAERIELLLLTYFLGEIGCERNVWEGFTTPRPNAHARKAHSRMELAHADPLGLRKVLHKGLSPDGADFDQEQESNAHAQ